MVWNVKEVGTSVFQSPTSSLKKNSGFSFPMSQGPNFMFQSILSRAVATLSAFGFAFALVSMVSGVANAQSGSTGFGGGGSATRSVAPSFGGGSGTTAQFGGGSGTTQFSGGGSGTTQFNGGGSGTTQFNGGGSGTNSGQINNGGQNCNCGQQQEPVEPPFDCSVCNLPQLPQINSGQWHYPQLPQSSPRIFRRQNCCGF